MKKKILVITLLGLFVVIFIHSTPRQCEAISLMVEKSDSIHDVATKLKDLNCLRSKGLFENYGILFNVRVETGLYVIPESKTFFEYLFLFEQKTYRQVVRITIPEGTPNKEIASLCAEKLPACDKNRFLEKAKSFEGYIFPETYEFFGTESEEELIDIARKEFDTESKALFDGLSESEKKNVIILASILEKEANTEKDMYLISGVLYKRLKIGMALQVDATLFYERGKTSAELSMSDLTKNSPYNTYTNTGLPPTPIGNPGIIALRAALNPKNSPYLFYLTGTDGNMRYARTYEDHLKNKKLYLK